MDNEFRAVVVSYRFECVRNFRSPTRYGPFYGMRASERTIGRRPAQSTDVYDRPAAQALGGSVPGTWAAHPERGSG